MIAFSIVIRDTENERSAIYCCAHNSVAARAYCTDYYILTRLHLLTLPMGLIHVVGWKGFAMRRGWGKLPRA